jgi:hypothetical protein
MPGAAGRDLPVCWIGCLAANKARDSLDDTIDLLEPPANFAVSRATACASALCALTASIAANALMAVTARSRNRERSSILTRPAK